MPHAATKPVEPAPRFHCELKVRLAASGSGHSKVRTRSLMHGSLCAVDVTVVPQGM
jgi:hypothetical protein